MTVHTDQTFVATFYAATRIGRSTNGNPSWNLETSEGVYPTERDGSIGYEIGNYTSGPGNLIGRRVRFTATKAGQVWDMKAVAELDS